MQSSKTSHELVRLNSDSESSTFEHYSVILKSDELEAVEGWRSANNVNSIGQALRELVRIGLLSELAETHELITQLRNTVD